MKIAVVTSKEQGRTDRVITETAQRLAAEGLRLAGVVKVPGVDAGDHHCDMDLQVLPDGPQVRITQSLGEGATGCRLDPAGIAAAVAATEKAGLAGVDVFILNKFGPQEAEGRGFCDTIAAALEAGIPVLVGVGSGSRAALDAFVDGLAEELVPETQALYDWCRAAAG